MDAVLAYLMGWEWPAILCLVLGVGLIVYEMFTPGFGVPGLLGLLTLVAAVVLRAKTVTDGLITLLLVIVLVGVLAFLFWRSLTKGRLSRSAVVLKESIDATSNDMEAARELVGREGVCLTALRPAGNADFGGRRIDVVSDGAFVPKGTRVVVERVEGLRVLVKAVEQNA